MIKKIGLLGILGFVLGCHSNPYSGFSGNYKKNPVENKPTLCGNFCIDAPPLVEIMEGSTSQVKIVGRVQTGTPIITFDNIPSWATYDVTTGILTCAPKIGDATDPNKPTETLRNYLVSVNLSSTSTGNAKSQQAIVIAVHHLAQGMQITGFDTGLRVNEGDSYQNIFQIHSLDFPNGPFYISGIDFPAGVKIASTGDPTKFSVTYAPSFTTIKTSNFQRTCFDRNYDPHMCNDLNFNLNVVDPRGNMSTVPVSWQVLDIRQNPLVVSPSPVTATFPTADFYVQVEDPNGEVPPQVSYVTPSGGSSVAQTTTASSGATATNNPYSMIHFVWSGNPSSSKGSTQYLDIKSCVQDDVNSMKQCVTNSVSVKF